MPKAGQDYKWSRVKMRILKCFASLPSYLQHTQSYLLHCLNTPTPIRPWRVWNQWQVLIDFKEKPIPGFFKYSCMYLWIQIFLIDVLVAFQELLNCASKTKYIKIYQCQFVNRKMHRPPIITSQKCPLWQGGEHWLSDPSPSACFLHWPSPAAFSGAGRVDLPARTGADRLQAWGSRGGRWTAMAETGPSPPALQYRGHSRIFHAINQKSCSESSSFELTKLLWFDISGNNDAIAPA